MPHTPENVENNSEVSHQTTFEKHKAERWEQYLQAVKQLRSKDASARVSGVHALVVLVDEWLHEENLSEDEKIKEGQLIINKLCAYICSPFTLASEYDELTQDSPAAEGLYKNREQEFYIHKAELQAEADMRLSIMKEIHRRLQGPDENTPGAWSDFEYDFSGSTFFYPVDLTHSYYTKPVHFSESVYWSSANFSGSTYLDWVGFSDSTYRGRADFSGSTYRGGADFHESIYQAEVDLSKSVYQDWADFHESTYWGDANFSESAYRSWADLQNSIYQGQADFSGSTYQEGVDLSCSIYWGRANFRGSIYEDEAAFSGSIFRDTIDFGKDTGSGGSSRFTRCAPAFYDEANQQNTLFDAPNNDFSVENSEGCPILLTPDGLPLDCRFLSTTQKDYLENTLRRLEETNDEFLAAKNHEVEKELSEKLRSLTQELDEWRREVTALPSDSPNNTEAPPQQTKYMKRPEEEVPWSPAGREAFSLLDDYRKNSNDHAKIYTVIKDILESHERQIKILAEQTQQCIENAFKERMAERRGRYAKAVEQLGNANAPVRIGGVYTLIGLADEWLLDENLDYAEKVREGQVIVNNLCAYIRSSFALAFHYNELTQESPTAEGLYKNREQEFYTDKAALESEANIRLNIMKEIHNRLQSPDKNTPGTWSGFEYDFSGSIFFYPVDLTHSYYTKPVNFSGSTYQDWVDFRGSIYQGRADFNSSTYQNVVYFSDSTYRGEVCFNKSTYRDFVYFDRSIYQNWADFYDSTYQDEASFTGSTYLDMVSFFDSTYQEVVSFSDSAYWNGGGFSNSIYQGEADFSNSIYVGGIGFSNSAYRGKANFSGSIYQGQVGLSNSTYEDEAAFSGSIFRDEIYCGQGTNSGSSSRFTQCAPEFYNETNHHNTFFGSHDNNFTAENGRGYPVYRNLEGLPLGCTFLTPAHKEYLGNIFQAMEEISNKNKIHAPHNPEETKERLEKLWSLTQELHEWREKVTTVKQ
ncbi:pentapeptide repeat-containing protein [Rothia aeria]|uniref:pentapeptide repeat-containing protein n=1 Tax=Rothia aeria TaxID=172042 RepID=UPI000AF61FAC|nr:pentapeptide repeat-containing protein [Rothia aeria]